MGFGTGGAGEAATVFFWAVSFLPVAFVFLPPSGFGPLGGGGVEESFGGPFAVFL